MEEKDLSTPPSSSIEVTNEEHEHNEKCEEYLAGWKRAQADYQNLKRETDQQKAEFAKYANERLFEDLLPAIDQYAMVLKYQPSTEGMTDDQRKQWDNWLIGVKAVWSNWEHVMQTAGLKLVTADKTFDPQLHEAVGTESAEDKASGEIIRITQEGWMLNGKVLRPAKVIIAE
jgi:molecular chaperone GrpE